MKSLALGLLSLVDPIFLQHGMTNGRDIVKPWGHSPDDVLMPLKGEYKFVPGIWMQQNDKKRH